MSSKMKIFETIFCSIILLSSHVSARRLSKISVDPLSGHFVDESGRVTIFHGINSVIKGFPWYDEKLLDRDRQNQISELGINVVRLGAMWTGLQPEQGIVNETYLDILEKIVSELAENGIYTILDMHQDVLWQAGPLEDKGYWGVPPWIKGKLELPEDLYPWPMVGDPSTWECGYITKEVSQGFGQLYDNVNNVANDLASFWKILANRFKSHSSVLGYELINEPGIGGVYEDLSLALPGLLGSQKFQPFYERITRAIRDVDEATIIFWEPALHSYILPFETGEDFDQSVVDFLSNRTLVEALPVLQMICGPMDNDTSVRKISQLKDLLITHLETSSRKSSIFGTGFDTPPGGPEFQNRTVMSWHYYCWGIYYGTDEPYDPLTRWFCDELMGPTVFKTAKRRSRETGGGSFLTEFGVCYPNISLPETVNTIECNAVLEMTEEHLESWAYWDTASGMVFWDDNGILVENLVAFFSRPYPVKTSGQPEKLSFDIYGKAFEYQFYCSENSTELPTEIYIPPIHYPNGTFEVQTSENLLWKISEQNINVILVFCNETTDALSTVNIIAPQ